MKLLEELDRLIESIPNEEFKGSLDDPQAQT